MSSREPMWYCHECHAEMRPLMTPDPVCASCQGSFVEKMENPTDDPREFQQHVPGEFDEGIPAGMDSFFLGLQALLGGQQNRPRSASPTAQRNAERGAGGLRFEIRTRTGDGERSFVLGGPNTLNPGSPGRDVPTMSEFIRRGNEQNPNRERGDITGPLMAQYLMALLGRAHERGGGGGDPFAEMFNGPNGDNGNGRWGDYVFNQEALDQVLTQLMENSTAGRPVPATEEIISNLTRDVLQANSPLLEKDCAVCKEQFSLETEDSDELVVVTLPCKHPFHESCIVPWLKSSGTCPVCRYALIPQPQPHSPDGNPPSGGRGSSSRPGSPSSPSRERSPGPSGRSGSGLFHTLFGGARNGGSGNGSNRTVSPRRSTTTHRQNSSMDSSNGTPSFPGRWSDEVD
ncbi:hypothetical protein BJ138DRAFT_1087664 [Hygrophoropsis aurantiaca]|uniref:Uncharacterized protein n=1 Tax=Hygrophoropsis aurantiaca TaxID=72124 RepID=A0ACB8AB69_9AGAM|nr:hypothetical protein BJ138DRAFT_1087664 [Hygrophoropsis aurantiaca]